MACLPAWDRQEQRFFSAINRADRLVVRGDRLLLLDKNDAPLVIFTPTDRD
jgi:heat shock protein HslJ